MKCNFNLIITANSPGEIIGFVYPLVYKAKEKFKGISVTLALLPCPFATGREKDVSISLTEIDAVLTTKETLSYIVFGKGINLKGKVVMVHLGGEPLYSILLSKRLRAYLWGYKWIQRKWDKFYRGYFAIDEDNLRYMKQRGISPHKIHVVGDLMVDSVLLRSSKCSSSRKVSFPTISFMPGSRLREVKILLPLFAGVFEKIKKEYPSAEGIVPISPFIAKDLLTDKKLHPHPQFGGVEVTWAKKNITTPSGVSLRFVENSIEAMTSSHFTVTIPGTSTAELGILGIPFLSVLPLNRLEDIPYVGIIGSTEYIPFIGKRIKGALLRYFVPKEGPFALPNIKAGKLIAPELIGEVSVDKIAQKVLPLLKSEVLSNISSELKKVYYSLDGAAEKMVNIISQDIEERGMS